MSADSPFAALLAELPIRREVVSVLGSDTAYWVYGADDAATTIVISHGYRGEHHGLEPVIGYLRDVRVIGPDLPGYGESSPMPGRVHDIAAYAEWYAAFVKALGLDGTAVVLGHSFGSMVTSYAVAKGLVSTPRLVLVNPIAASALEGPSALLTRGTALYYKLTLALPERAGRWLLDNWVVIRFMSLSLIKTRNRELRRFVHDQHHTYFGRFSDRRTVAEGFAASISTDVSAVASDIAVPTLLIGAEHDVITSVAQLEALQRQMTDATLHVIPDVGHLVHYEKARVAAGMIVDFLGTGRVADGAATAASRDSTAFCCSRSSSASASDSSSIGSSKATRSSVPSWWRKLCTEPLRIGPGSSCSATSVSTVRMRPPWLTTTIDPPGCRSASSTMAGIALAATASRSSRPGTGVSPGQRESISAPASPSASP
jgi:pimeloyl-ACP methyl ester carboxylesterase